MYRVIVCALAASALAARSSVAGPQSLLSPSVAQPASEEPQARYAAASGPFAFLEAIFGGSAEARQAQRSPDGPSNYSANAYAAPHEDAGASDPARW